MQTTYYKNMFENRKLKNGEIDLIKIPNTIANVKEAKNNSYNL